MNVLAPLKASKAVAAGMAWFASFGLVNITTGQAVVAAFFAFLSAALAAWLASRPALLQARTAAEQQHSTEAEQADARQERMHAREVAWLKSRIIYNGQVAFLKGESKHKLLSYSQEVAAYAEKLQRLLREAGMEVPEFRFKFYDELCGEEDRALALLTLPPDFQPTQTGEMPRMEG